MRLAGHLRPNASPLLLAAVCAVAAAGCARRERAPLTTHLVDVFRPEMVAQRGRDAPAAPARAGWRFEDAAGAHGRGWERGPGITDLDLRHGRLQGRTTTDVPILHLTQPPPADGSDVLEEVEVRMSASKGTNLNI